MRYKIRALKLGEILDQTVSVIKDHFGVLFAITAVLMIPYWLIGGLIQAAMMPRLPPNPSQEQMMAAGMSILKVSIPMALLGIYVVTPITNAALVYGVSNAYLGRPVGVGDSYGRAFRRLLPLIGTWFLVGLAIMGGLILCLVPGILAMFWFALATQVVVIEDESGFAAMRRSKELMAGNVGTFFVLGILVWVISVGISFAGSLIPQPYVQAVVNAFIMAISTIVWSVAFVVFYVSCRCRHEQFDLTLLAQSVGVEKPAELGDELTREW